MAVVDLPVGLSNGSPSASGDHSAPACLLPAAPPALQSSRRFPEVFGRRAGGHVGSEDVAGVPVEIRPGPVVARGRSRGRRGGRLSARHAG